MKAGDKCPVCGRGRFKAVLEEVEKGVRVEGFKCGRCRKTFFTQKNMEKIEALQRLHAEERRLVRIGNSLAAIIPAKIARKMGLKEKEKVFVEEADGKIIITASVR